MSRQPYDYSPLTEKITIRQLFADINLSMDLKIGIGIAIIALVLPIIAIGTSSSDMLLSGLLIYAFVLVMVIVATTSVLINRFRYLKLRRFAERNSMIITRDFDLLHHPGAPFQSQTPADTSIALAATDGPTIEIGNFVAIGRNSMPTAYGSFGFIRFILPREFPHIILDAKSSDVVTHSTAAPLSDYAPEVIKLEGDFPDTFHVYAPAGYGSDLRYILPPDFMAFLVDHASMFDIEIIDNELYLYGVDFFSMTDPIALEEVFTYADEFQQALQTYLVPYVDWRMSDRSATTVAPEAKQLSKASPRNLIIILLSIALFIAYYSVRALL